MAEVRNIGAQAAEAPYEKPEVRICRDPALIRAALPEGYLDPILDLCASAFRAHNAAWDGQFHLCVSFNDSDSGRLYVYDSLLSDDENDPISHRVKLGLLSRSVFANLMTKMNWTW